MASSIVLVMLAPALALSLSKVMLLPIGVMMGVAPPGTLSSTFLASSPPGNTAAGCLLSSFATSTLLVPPLLVVVVVEEVLALAPFLPFPGETVVDLVIR